MGYLYYPTESDCRKAPKSEVLNMWVMTFGGVKCSFHRCSLRLPENTDIYIMVHNNSKIPAMK